MLQLCQVLPFLSPALLLQFLRLLRSLRGTERGDEALLLIRAQLIDHSLEG